MNCKYCRNPSHFVVEDTGNCISRDSEINYYYKNLDTHKFEKCYETCKTCNEKGNILYHK